MMCREIPERKRSQGVDSGAIIISTKCNNSNLLIKKILFLPMITI
jgi:hypothetical protein